MISTNFFNLLVFLCVMQTNFLFAQSQSQNGWKFFANTQGGHCYNIFQTNTMKFNEAKVACNIMGGYLATIDDQIEFDFLSKTLLNNTNLKNANPPFVWVNIIKAFK